MDNTALRRRALAALVALCGWAAAEAAPIPSEGRFNLRCSISIRTVGGPPAPLTITPTYAVDLTSKTWCTVEDHCVERYALSPYGESAIEFTIQDSLTEREKFLVNLENGKLIGYADDAPNGLFNGFRTYLAEGDCVPLPYAEGGQP